MTEKVATAVKLRLDKKRDLSSENKYKYEMQMKINFHAQLKIVNKFPSFPVSQFFQKWGERQTKRHPLRAALIKGFLIMHNIHLLHLWHEYDKPQW